MEHTELEVLSDSLADFKRSKLLFLTVQFGIYDTLSRKGPCKLTSLLESLQIPSDSLNAIDRVLKCTVSLGFLLYQDGLYSNTAMSEKYLTSQSPFSLLGYIYHSDAVVYKLFSGLEGKIRTNASCWKEQLGFEMKELFQYLYCDTESQLRFINAMHSFARMDASRVLSAFDLSCFKTLVDLGGATGALMMKACELYPESSAIVVDLPHIIETAKNHFSHLAPQGSNSKLLWFAADFFLEPDKIPQGDLYVLSRILHDWEEEKIFKILKLIYAKLPPGGAVLICEMLLQEDGCGPLPVLLQSLNMLVQTHGKERSLEEYKILLESVGFENVQGKCLQSYLDAVIAYKPRSSSGCLQ